MSDKPVQVGVNLPESAGEALSKAVGIPEAVVADATRFLGAVIGKPLRIASGMLADELYAWQCRNRIQMVLKAQECLRGKSIPAGSLPKGFLMPLLDAVGNVEEEDLQQLWARLLATATTDSKHAKPVFIDTLRRMTSTDAKTFADLARMNPRPSLGCEILLDQLLETDHDALARLVSIGLLEWVLAYRLRDRGWLYDDGITPKYDVEEDSSRTSLAITPYGELFIEALNLTSRGPVSF